MVTGAYLELWAGNTPRSHSKGEQSPLPQKPAGPPHISTVHRRPTKEAWRRGGQSALRFARLREEKRHNYVRKVAELAVQHFIVSDKVNVQASSWLVAPTLKTI